jgi:hypothetical protein
VDVEETHLTRTTSRGEALAYLRAVEALEQRLPTDNGVLKVAQVATVLGWSRATVYDSLHRYDAAVRHGDLDAARRSVPCVHSGGTLDTWGNATYGRWTITRHAFITWYLSAGMASPVPREAQQVDVAGEIELEGGGVEPSIFEDLAKLGQLHAADVLTDEEFMTLKARVIG